MLTDIYMRDRLDGYYIVNNVTPKPLDVSEWAAKNRYIKFLIKSYNEDLGDTIKSSIESYCKRIEISIKRSIVSRQIMDKPKNF